jgi:hypothetical protein
MRPIGSESPRGITCESSPPVWWKRRNDFAVRAAIGVESQSLLLIALCDDLNAERTALVQAAMRQVTVFEQI